ncbi:MAG: FkbM family methyltransferase [Longimicrobiales bacterium]
MRRVQKLKASSRDARSKWEVAHAALKRASASRHRRILSPDIVRSLLPSRVATMPARAARANARAAASQLETTSSAYREALASVHGAVDGVVRTNLEGLTWWVSIHPSVTGAARERVVAKQRFPFRNITQAREFALGPVMLDIGANIGRMSIPRVILGDFVQVYCAEPDPLNYAALVRNVVDNGLRGLVLPDCVAIGAETGTAHLRHAKYSGGHRLVSEEDTSDTIEVPCSRLDDWCEHLAIDPQLVTYVKVDTQGWEREVLRGAPTLLTCRHIAWQIEISPSMLSAAGSSPVQLYDMCAEHFSHFIDLGKRAEGPRVRRTRDLGEALDYVQADDSQTDAILFNSESMIG